MSGHLNKPCPQCGRDIRSDYTGVCRSCYISNATHTLAERFWPKVDVRGPDECWPWLAARNKWRYGVIQAGGHKTKMLLAHRVAWELTSGEIPRGKWVLHHCDNPPCCNPKHGWLGNHADNMADMKNKGRGHHPDWRGETHPSARLTQADVDEIRASRERGTSIALLCAAFRIGSSQCYRIIKRQSWR